MGGISVLLLIMALIVLPLIALLYWGCCMRCCDSMCDSLWLLLFVSVCLFFISKVLQIEGFYKGKYPGL